MVYSLAEGDVDPALFNEQPHEKLGRVDRERDEWEIFYAERHGWRECPFSEFVGNSDPEYSFRR